MFVVVYPAATDVERPRRPVERQPAEDETALGILERPHPPLRPSLHVERCPLRRHRLLRASDRRAHPVELVVGVVDVGLLGFQFRVRHGPPTVPT